LPITPTGIKEKRMKHTLEGSAINVYGIMPVETEGKTLEPLESWSGE
jgi:hypothetical protein